MKHSYEAKRGCGIRARGGLYMVSGAAMEACGKLPIELHVCPTCHTGIKPSRGWTWMDIRPFIRHKACSVKEAFANAPNPAGLMCNCVLDGDHTPERVGVLWIGEKFYPTPTHFMLEGERMGFSRRVSAIPNDFELGKTWVAFAHRKGIVETCDQCNGVGSVDASTPREGNIPAKIAEEECVECNGKGKHYTPAIFTLFKPTAVEYIVKDNDDPKKLERLEKKGVTLVRAWTEKFFDEHPLEWEDSHVLVETVEVEALRYAADVYEVRGNDRRRLVGTQYLKGLAETGDFVDAMERGYRCDIRRYAAHYPHGVIYLSWEQSGESYHIISLRKIIPGMMGTDAEAVFGGHDALEHRIHEIVQECTQKGIRFVYDRDSVITDESIGEEPDHSIEQRHNAETDDEDDTLYADEHGEERRQLGFTD